MPVTGNPQNRVLGWRMKKIDPNFKPDERSYNNLRKHGAIPEFVDHELPMFITYFVESGAKKKSWQMTVQRWMRSAWAGKAGRDWEYNRHKRQDNGSSGDLFAQVLGTMKSPLQEVDELVEEFEGIKQKYRLPDPPEKGEAMNPADAFKQIKGILK